MYIAIGIAVFALQIWAYRVISRKLEMRRSVKRRLGSLVYEQPAARQLPRFSHNRPGEN